MLRNNKRQDEHFDPPYLFLWLAQGKESSSFVPILTFRHPIFFFDLPQVSCEAFIGKGIPAGRGSLAVNRRANEEMSLGFHQVGRLVG